MESYRCPCCRKLLELVETRPRDGSIDLHFECMTCSHILSIIVNVPTFVPHRQWYNYNELTGG